MDYTPKWTIELFIDEHDGQTRASARLRTRDNEVTGHGLARRHPHDANVPEIGDELAVARALSDLAHKLFDATIGDIEAITRRPPVESHAAAPTRMSERGRS
jgi:uncharacterized protein DUF1876